MACPFCRELFTEGELSVCPNCDIVLRPLADLPPSFEVREQQAAEWEQTAPADRTFAWSYTGRGRALLLALSAAGLGLFFCPWVAISIPELATLSGFQLTTSRGFWFGGGAVGCLISIPLVLSRRTIVQMHGVRIVLTLFAATTLCQALLLALNPPHRGVIPVQYHWTWGFYASALISLLSVPVALRFGGRLDDVPETFGRKSDPRAQATEGSKPEVGSVENTPPSPKAETSVREAEASPRVLH
ncbi:MAG: hypothetical protein RJA70_21 [Pseudomonadota bacterium]|jgi:MFS family permease